MSTELVELPTFYAAPGFLLLALDDREPVGCVGVRALGPSHGELRRLFVRPERRSAGVGAEILSRAETLAADRGLRELVLTTLPTMTAARALYDRHGYEPIEPYGPDPVDGVQYLGRRLPRECRP